MIELDSLLPPSIPTKDHGPEKFLTLWLPRTQMRRHEYHFRTASHSEIAKLRDELLECSKVEEGSCDRVASTLFSFRVSVSRCFHLFEWLCLSIHDRTPRITLGTVDSPVSFTFRSGMAPSQANNQTYKPARASILVSGYRCSNLLPGVL